MLINQNSLSLHEPVKKYWLCFGITISGQWNQVLAGVVCALGFALIFGFMIINAMDHVAKVPGRFRNVHLASEAGGAPRMLGMSGAAARAPKCGSYLDCALSCWGMGPADDLTVVVQTGFENIKFDHCENLIKLSIQSSVLKDGLTKNFLNVTFNVQELNFETTTIRRIEPGAFAADCFSQLDKLTLTKINIDHLKSGAFAGLQVLTEFNIREGILIKVDPDVILPFHRTLRVLQIIQITNAFDPTNFTGSHPLGSAATVDLQSNNMEIIRKGAFAGLVACQQLYLGNSQIVKIQDYAFGLMKSVIKIYIHNNHITTLNKNVLGNYKDVFKIFLQNNEWNCDCRLQWIQDFENENHVADAPLCAAPEGAADRNFSSVDFCPRGTSTTATGTDQPPTTATSSTDTAPVPPVTSPAPEPTVDLVCKIPSDSYDLINRKVYSRRKLLTVNENVQVTSQTIRFNVSNRETGIVDVEAEIPETGKASVVWFTDESGLASPLAWSGLVGCASMLSSRVRLGGLRAGESYTFCVFGESETKISPFNCRAHVTQERWEWQKWLSNRDKPVVTVYGGIGLISCILVGAAAVYFLVRRNPSLLRGSKRVVMVKHRAAEVIVMPSNFKEIEDLSDERKHYRVLHNKRANFRRSVSETSVLSGRSVDASYVSAVEPTAVQLLHWRLERLRSGDPRRTEGAGALALALALAPPPASPLSGLPPLPPRRPASPALNYEFDNLSGISEGDLSTVKM